MAASPTQTLPAPRWSAALPARMAAPTMPSLPPTIPSVPKLPLCTLRRARRNGSGSWRASEGQSRRRPGAPAAVVEPQRMHANRAAIIRAVRREQTRLERNEGRGRVRADRGSMRDPGIGVKPARNIQSEDPCRAGIGARNPLRGLALDGTLEADPEQAVDDQVPVATRRPVGTHRAAGIAPRLVRRGSGGGELSGIAMESNRDLEEPALEPARNDQRIAAVVSGTGEDQHAWSASGEQVAGTHPQPHARHAPSTARRPQRVRSRAGRPRDRSDRIPCADYRPWASRLATQAAPWTFRRAVVTLA